MAITDTSHNEIYVLRVEAVRRAIDRLVATPSHEHLPGYLAIYSAQARHPGQRAQMSDIVDFHDRYLRVPGAPAKAPYLRPFKSRGRGAELMNENVAGSYAPSSVRNKGKFPLVVDVFGNGQDGSYSLKKDHAARAVGDLLGGHKIPDASLAVFLLRDHGLEMSKPSFSKFMELFRIRFRMRLDYPEEKAVYDTLFEDDTSNFSDADIERLVRPSPNGKNSS